ESSVRYPARKTKHDLEYYPTSPGVATPGLAPATPGLAGSPPRRERDQLQHLLRPAGAVGRGLVGVVEVLRPDGGVRRVLLAGHPLQGLVGPLAQGDVALLLQHGDQGFGGQVV